MKDLTTQDFLRAAAALGCDVAAVQAVCAVEAPKGGFLADGRPVILFEAHVFSRLTQHRFDIVHPEISSTTWNRRLYKGGVLEWSRLDLACTLDRNAALQSASWGRFQLMGFNFHRCGFTSVESFVQAMSTDEGRQLDAFVAFVRSMGLDDELRRQDWAGFALGYNGKGYAENHYDARLLLAYSLAGGPAGGARPV